MIGNWFKKNGKRNDIILATKVVGRSSMTWFRDNGNEPELTKEQITEAIDKSLKRLNTDYIDLSINYTGLIDHTYSFWWSWLSTFWR